jgi:type IV pilus assembly protein PilC
MADNYDFEADAATTQLITFIEPVMIIVMALIVGTVMLAVMMPIMSMYKSAGG